MTKLAYWLRVLVMSVGLGLLAPSALAATAPSGNPLGAPGAPAATAPVTCSPTSSDPALRCNTFLDGVMVFYQQASLQAIDNLLPYAKHAFWTLLALEIMGMLLMWALMADGGWTFVVNGLLKRIATILVFGYLMVNTSGLAFSIVETFAQAGSVATGGAATLGGPVSPSSIIGYGQMMAWNMLSSINDIPVSTGDAGLLSLTGVGNLIKSGLMTLVYAILVLIAAVAVAVLMIWVGIELLMTQIQGYLALALATFLFAMSAFRYTEHLAQNAWRMLLNFGVKLMTIVFLSSIGLVVLDQAQQAWLTSAQNADTPVVQMLSGMMMFVSVVIVFAALVVKLPTLVTDMMNGSLSLGAKDAADTGKVAGSMATRAAGGALAAGAVGALGVGGLVGGVKAGLQALRSGGDTGPSAGGGAPSSVPAPAPGSGGGDSGSSARTSTPAAAGRPGGATAASAGITGAPGAPGAVAGAPSQAAAREAAPATDTVNAESGSVGVPAPDQAVQSGSRTGYVLRAMGQGAAAGWNNAGNWAGGRVQAALEAGTEAAKTGSALKSAAAWEKTRAPATDAQLNQAQKLTAETGAEIPQNAYKSERAMGGFIREQAYAANPANQAPTPAQVKMADALAQVSGQPVPESAHSSKAAMAQHIKEAQMSYQADKLAPPKAPPAEPPRA